MNLSERNDSQLEPEERLWLAVLNLYLLDAHRGYYNVEPSAMVGQNTYYNAYREIVTNHPRFQYVCQQCNVAPEWVQRKFRQTIKEPPQTRKSRVTRG